MRAAIALTLLVSAPLLLGATPAPQAQGAVNYTLSPVIRDGALEALQVEIRLRGDRSGTTRLDLPETGGGQKELWRNLRDLKIDGARSVAEDGPAHRIIRASPGAPLTISYRVVSSIDHEPARTDREPFAPWVRPTWFYAFGDAIFAVPQGRDKAPVRFDWAGAPSDFSFASDLEELAGAHRRAVRPGAVGDIQQSVLLGGKDLEVITRQVNGAPVRVAVHGHFTFSGAEFADLAARVIRAERSFWSDKGAPYLITLAPVVTSPGSMSLAGSGQRDAFGLAISPSAKLSQLRWLFAHEYFHNWNPAQLGGLPEGPEQRLGYWFSEGFTDFYTRRVLVRYGLFTPEEFATEWNQMLAAYAASPVRAEPNARIKNDFWTSETVQKLPYQRGALLAAIWDARLRKASSARVNLDDVLKAQRAAARRPKTSPENGAAGLFPVVAARFGLDVRGDIARYIERGEPILLPGDVFGPCARIETADRPAFDYGFDMEATRKAEMVVTGLRPDSPAYAAGLRDGMKLLKREAGEPGDSRVDYVIRVKDGDQERVIRFKPEARALITVQEVVLTPGQDPKACARSLGGLS